MEVSIASQRVYPEMIKNYNKFYSGLSSSYSALFKHDKRTAAFISVISKAVIHNDRYACSSSESSNTPRVIDILEELYLDDISRFTDILYSDKNIEKESREIEILNLKTANIISDLISTIASVDVKEFTKQAFANRNIDWNESTSWIHGNEPRSSISVILEKTNTEENELASLLIINSKGSSELNLLISERSEPLKWFSFGIPISALPIQDLIDLKEVVIDVAIDVIRNKYSQNEIEHINELISAFDKPSDLLAKMFEKTPSVAKGYEWMKNLYFYYRVNRSGSLPFTTRERGDMIFTKYQEYVKKIDNSGMTIKEWIIAEYPALTNELSEYSEYLTALNNLLSGETSIVLSMIATRLKELGVRYNGLDKDVRDYDPLPIFSSSNHCLSQGTKLTAIDGDQNQVNRTFTLGIGESVFHENIIPIFETSIYLSINKWSSDYFYAMPNHRSGNFGSSYSEPTEDQIKERLKYGMNEGDYLVEQANAAWVSVVEEDGVMVPYLSLVCQKNGSVIRHVKLDGAIRYAKDYVFGDRLFSGMLFLDKSLHNFYSGIKDEGVGVLIKSSVLSVNKPNSETVNNIIGVQSLVNNY